MKKRLLALIMILVFAVSSVTVTATGAAAETASDDDAVVRRNEAEAELAGTAAVGFPAILGVAPTAKGVTVRWSSFLGADQYFLFIKKADGGWKVIGKTKATSFEHRFDPNGATYTYTVRAADRNGSFVSLSDPTGYSFACLPAPVPVSVENTPDGQKFSWKAVRGAVSYKVYVKADNGWTPIGDTAKTSFLNRNVRSGRRYSYTVRCWDKTKNLPVSYFDRRGVSAVFIAAPKISGFQPVKNGICVQWNPVKGASRYCVFVKANGKWKRIGYTAKTSFNHTNLNDKRIYFYTVRCVDEKGNFISGADAMGSSFRFLLPPRITSVADGVISWNKIAVSPRCRVYRKNFGGKWIPIGVTEETSYTDDDAPRNTLYQYTVRCLDSSNNLLSYFFENNLYYYNGNPANGRIAAGGASLLFDNGRLRQGFVTIGGKTYYYSKTGVLQKNCIVGNANDGYRYADKNGVINFSYTGLATDSSGVQWYLTNGRLDRTLRTAVTVGGVDYVVVDGKAHKVRTEEERTFFRALKLANRVADRSLPKAKRLKILFDYIKGAYVEKNPRIPHFHGKNWHVIYANDMLVNGVGNCMSYGAEFAFLAKAIGYDEAYACNSSGHGWAEIDGLVYDPEWSRHRFRYSYYALSYNTKTDQDYRGAISAGYWWMRVKVCPHL